jgi:hypothetical protein
MACQVTLRDMVEGDMPVFFEQQLDAEANEMAAFTSTDPTDRNAFMAHCAKILGDPEILMQRSWSRAGLPATW